jgi:pSer/pThr/pTyr-binding forkhead associated (FHA) protein
MWLITMDQIVGVGPYELTSGIHVIGRGRDCDYVIREPTLSRHHARIHVSGQGTIVLEDLGSKNGTYVDDVKVSRQPLSNSSLIRIGSVRLYLSANSGDQSAESSEETKTRRRIRREPVLNLPLANLTPVQREVFDLVVAGCDENAIAERLGRSFHTVHHHVQAIYRKMGVHSRNELLALVLSSSK